MKTNSIICLCWVPPRSSSSTQPLDACYQNQPEQALNNDLESKHALFARGEKTNIVQRRMHIFPLLHSWRSITSTPNQGPFLARLTSSMLGSFALSIMSRYLTIVIDGPIVRATCTRNAMSTDREQYWGGGGQELLKSDYHQASPYDEPRAAKKCY